jgi:hypothetical protein
MLSIEEIYNCRRMLSRLLNKDGIEARGDLNGDIMSLRDDDNNILSISSNIGFGGNNTIIITLNDSSKNQIDSVLSKINTIIKSFVMSNKDLLGLSYDNMDKFEEFVKNNTRLLFDLYIMNNVITIGL